MILSLVLQLGILLLLSFPMFVVLSVPGISGIQFYFKEIAPFISVQRMFAGLSPFSLVSLPLFILAADIMVKGQMSIRLINFAQKFVGHLHGGLAQTLCLSCMAFGALSGSTQATVAAIGGNMYPSLVKAGYDESFGLALTAISATVAILIPPSIAFIVFGVLSGTSIGALFLAGILPGILLGLSFMVYCYWWAKKHKVPLLPRAKIPEILDAGKEAAWPLGLPLIIIGGIYTGIMTPTEAAAASVAYALFVEMVIFRTMTLKDFYKIALGTGTVSAVVFILVATAEPFAWVLIYSGVPDTISNYVNLLNPSPFGLLMLINLVFFIALCFFNAFSMQIVLVPLLFPIIQAYGIDPVHFGTLVVMNCAIGTCTPPFGADLFTTSAIFRVPFWRVVKGIPVFIIISNIILVICTYFPQISLWIPRSAGFK